MSRKGRQALVERKDSRLFLVCQCSLLGIIRDSVYYQPKPTGAGNLDLMDPQYMKTPFYASRRMKVWARRPRSPYGSR
jgi:putative transposase